MIVTLLFLQTSTRSHDEVDILHLFESTGREIYTDITSPQARQ